MEPYLRALAREAESQAEEMPGGPLSTIYFGGGTPSMMSPEQLSRLLATFESVWSLTPKPEITIEAHPSTVDADKLGRYMQSGANRLSFGAESMQSGELKSLGRQHGEDRVREVVEIARWAGFSSINLDLMYGIPTQTRASWRDSLHRVVKLRPDHLSLYPLSIEPKTIFARAWRQNALHIPDDDQVSSMYDDACALLTAAGYIHYEVANWALPGHLCRHNLAYWRNREYYGLGVGAHAYLRPYRIRNVEHTRPYIDRTLSRGMARCESVYLDADSQLNETAMLGLRLLQEGVNIRDIREKHGVDLLVRAGQEGRRLLDAGMLTQRGDRLLLSESAVPVANEIWQTFLSTSPKVMSNTLSTN